MSEFTSENQPDLDIETLPEEQGTAEAAGQEQPDMGARINNGRGEPMWYVVHTYSGYENKVKDTLEKSLKSSGMQDYIFEVRVPVEEVTEIKKGKRVKTTRKVFPGYVIVNMIHTPESWYVVRNTRGVTGFVGPDGKPVALTEAEIKMMLNPQKLEVEFDLAIGEPVIIQEGAFIGQEGVIVDIDKALGQVNVMLQPLANRTMEQWFPMTDVISAVQE